MQVEGAVEIDRDKGVLKEEVPLADGPVVEAGKLVLGTPRHLEPVFSIGAPFEAQFVLHLLGEVIKGKRQRFVVVLVLVGAVAEHVPARDPGPPTILGEAVVFDAQRIVPLPVDLKGIEDGHLVEVVLSGRILGGGEVELEVIVGANAEHRQPLVR